MITYEMRIFDYEGDLVKIFTNEDFISLRYDIILNDVGTFACVFDSKHNDWLTTYLMVPEQLDYFIEIYRYFEKLGGRVKEDTYFLRTTNPFEDANGNKFFAIGGHSLNHLLQRRCIDPRSDSRGAGGFVTDAGTASDVIANLVKEHLGENASTARRFPNFTTHSDHSGYPAGGRWRYDKVLKAVQTLATKGLVQFKITRTSANNLRFNVGTLATDRSVTANYPNGEYTLIDRRRGNLTEPNLMIDYLDQENFVYALGDGDKDNQNVLEVLGDGVTFSPFNRIEFSSSIKRDDASNSLYMLTGAVEALSKKKAAIEMEFPILEYAGFRYRTDFDIGDTVTVKWNNYEEDLTVVSIEVSVAGDDDTLSIRVEKS